MLQPSISDRSFQYGDGLFTTIRVHCGQLLLWPYHWQRLAASLHRLGMASVDEQWLKQYAQQQITAPEQVLKIVVSRGQGGRGYSPAGFSQANCYVSTSPLPDYRPQQQQGIHLGIAQLQLGIQPLLAGMKHTSRLETVLLKAEVERRQEDDLLCCDHSGLVTELSAANVFFYLDGGWHTPKLHQAGVAGVTRQWLLDQLQIIPGCYTLTDVRQSQSMLATNALMGVVPVRQFESRTLDLQPVRALQQDFYNIMKQEQILSVAAMSESDYFSRDTHQAEQQIQRM